MPELVAMGGNAVFASTTQMGDGVAPPVGLAEPKSGR